MSSQQYEQAEQRRLGANGVDVIDELCEASIFDEAAKYLTRTKLKVSNEQKLTFYALFKQATIGPCNTSKPSILNMYERTKWNAWNELGKMSKDEAIMRYVNELEKVAPSWKEEAGNVGAADSDSDESDGGGGGGGTGGAMMHPQSRPIEEEEVPESDVPDAQKDIAFYAKLNRPNMIRQLIEKGESVDKKDEEGMTALHWAVDRGHEDLVKLLLTEFKANINAQDGDGSTPLHYAAMCEHLPLISALLQHGADPTIEDDTGETAAAAVRQVKGLPQETLQLLDQAKSKKE